MIDLESNEIRSMAARIANIVAYVDTDDAFNSVKAIINPAQMSIFTWAWQLYQWNIIDLATYRPSHEQYGWEASGELTCRF